jgi:RNA polymerase sigma factor (sigma-70 family)
MAEHYDFMAEVSLNIAKKESDDLLHCVVEQMLNRPEAYEDLTDQQIRWTFLKIMKLNYHSVTSRYHYEYRKVNQSYNDWDDNYHNVSEEFINDKIWLEEKLDEVNEALEGLHWFHKVLFNRYFYEQRSYSELSEVTGIPQNTIATSIRNTKKYLKENLT